VRICGSQIFPHGSFGVCRSIYARAATREQLRANLEALGRCAREKVNVFHGRTMALENAGDPQAFGLLSRDIKRALST
jgi:hypothetical protein